MTLVEILAQLIDMQHELEIMCNVAEESNLPTSITMGLDWLKEDTVKVIIDVNMALSKMGQ